MSIFLKKRMKQVVIFSAFLILPGLAQAAPSNLQDVVKLFTNLNLLLLIPIAFSLGLLYFVWRGAVYIFKAGSEEGKTEGRRVLVWGIVSLFLMASVWGIIALFQSDLIGANNPTTLPIQKR